MSKKLAIILVLVLLALNLGAGYFIFYSAKIKADTLVSSAKTAAGSITTQNASIFGLNTGSLPKIEVAGADPGGITKYRKAMRTAYSKVDGTETAEYKALAPVNVILSYYKTELGKNNWIIDTITPNTISFTKDSQKIYISGTYQSSVTTFTIVLK